MRAVLILAAALILAAPAPGLAQTSTASSFTLQNVAFTPQQTLIIDGVSWRCGQANVCVGTGGQSQPASRACRRVVARLGLALASFTFRGVALTDDQLSACNVAAA